jgi:hypothetical protein
MRPVLKLDCSTVIVENKERTVGQNGKGMMLVVASGIRLTGDRLAYHSRHGAGGHTVVRSVALVEDGVPSIRQGIYLGRMLVQDFGRAEILDRPDGLKIAPEALRLDRSGFDPGDDGIAVRQERGADVGERIDRVR